VASTYAGELVKTLDDTEIPFFNERQPLQSLVSAGAAHCIMREIAGERLKKNSKILFSSLEPFPSRVTRCWL
jgi:hypothetical protein